MPKGAAPWWLEPGTETCEFCLRAYHFEAAHYCVACDCAICPSCVVHDGEQREALLCPACHAVDDR